MTRFLIYLFPAIMDVVIGAVFFVTIGRMTLAGRSGLQVSLLICSWAIIYSITSLIMGRVTTRRNAATMIIIAAVGTMLTAISYLTFPSLNLQYVFTGFIGVFTAMFFGPFQVFMRAVEDGKPAGVRRSTALYTFSWSFGMACGPFLSGFIIKWYDWRGCHIMNAGLALVVAVGTWLLKHHAEHKPSHPDGVSPPAESAVSGQEYAKMPDLAWLGWIFAGVGCFSVTIIRSLFQYKAEPLGISEVQQGIIIALVSYSQAFTALFLGRFRYWMYHRWMPLGLSTCGAVGLLIFGFATSVPAFYVGAILYGFFSSSFFFYLVFHSLVHPERSTVYISINEVVVGITGIIAPIAGGMIADYTNRNMPFLVMVPLVAAAAILQFHVHSGRKVKAALAERQALNG